MSKCYDDFKPKSKCYYENTPYYDHDYPDVVTTFDDDPEVQNKVSIEQVLGAPKENTMPTNVKLIARPQRGFIATSLNVGEYARIVDATHNGHIVLKTRLAVVDITDPSNVWDVPFAAPMVERLSTGDKLEITVGFTTDFEQRILTIANKGQNKIAAIKEVREATNWGLKESKDYVESLLLKF